MQFGEQFDPNMLDSVRLQSMVLEQLISRALLRDAAVNAVSQWVYQPYMLNNQAVPVTTTVTVNFTLQ